MAGSFKNNIYVRLMMSVSWAAMALGGVSVARAQDLIVNNDDRITLTSSNNVNYTNTSIATNGTS